MAKRKGKQATAPNPGGLGLLSDEERELAQASDEDLRKLDEGREEEVPSKPPEPGGEEGGEEPRGDEVGDEETPTGDEPGEETQREEPGEETDKAAEGDKKRKSRAQERIRELANKQREFEQKLEEEKKAREKAEQEAREYQEKLTRYDERRRMIDEAAKEHEEREEEKKVLGERPDPDEDPVGAEMWDLKKKNLELEKKQQAMEETTNRSTEEIRTSMEAENFRNWVDRDMSDARKETPGFDDAMKYLTDKRVEFWMSVGNTPEGAMDIVRNEAAAIAWQARQSGKSAARAYYDLARQWGYQPPGEEQPPEGRRPAADNGKRITKEERAKRELEQAEKGQAVQGLGGKQPPGDEGRHFSLSNLTKEQIANMSDEEWLTYMSDPVKKREIELSIQKIEGVA